MANLSILNNGKAKDIVDLQGFRMSNRDILEYKSDEELWNNSIKK